MQIHDLDSFKAAIKQYGFDSFWGLFIKTYLFKQRPDLMKEPSEVDLDMRSNIFAFDNIGELYEIGLAFDNQISKKQLGQYYTPKDTCQFMAQKTVDLFISDSAKNKSPVLEPRFATLKRVYDDVCVDQNSHISLNRSSLTSSSVDVWGRTPKRDSAISTLSWKGALGLAMTLPFCVMRTSSVAASNRYLSRFACNSTVVTDMRSVSS